MNEPVRPDVDQLLDTLKDFQRRSMEYIFDQLVRKNATNRFLLADEVGLGKTMVARGVVARVVDELWDKKDRIDVAYICSNAEIARQNINRLNISKDVDFQQATRLSLMPMQVRNIRQKRLNFIALTPNTSFNLRSHLGIAYERWMLYWLLRRTWPDITTGVAPMNVLEGHMRRDRFRDWVHRYKPEKIIDQTLQEEIVQELRQSDRKREQTGKITRQQEFLELCDYFKGRRQGRISPSMRQQRDRFVGELRSLVARVSVASFQPDLVILDEFQRFKELLRTDNDAGFLARHLFDAKSASVLLLSATPYKMYTLHGNDEEDHYADFIDTLHFLFDDPSQTDRLKTLLQQYRSELYRLERGESGRIMQIKQQLEQLLCRVMARTERLSVSPDRDGMLREVSGDPVTISREDVRAYVQLQGIARLLDRGSVMEYWKSAPYLLNFMENYELKRTFRRRIGMPEYQPALQKRLKESKNQLLHRSRIDNYQTVDPSNPRVRRLMQEMLDNDSWKMLWLSPSLPYYRLQGPFGNQNAQQMTKRLIFSSWFVVPRSLSVLLSYEAERRMMLADPYEDTEYAAYTNRKPLLNFSRSHDRLTGMPVLSLIYPSFTLAQAGDPLTFRQSSSNGSLPGVDEVLQAVRERLEHPVAELTRRFAGPESDRESERDDETWYWAAPLLLDVQSDPDAAEAWWRFDELENRWSDEAGEEGWKEHVKMARQLVDGDIALGRPPGDLTDVLAKLAVAGPANCALRAISRVTGEDSAGCVGSGNPTERAALNNPTGQVTEGHPNQNDRLQNIRLPEFRIHAGRIAWAFRSLFNLPTSINLIRGHNRKEPYWERVLEYCADGCLQSVMDEYSHVLRESLGLIDADPVKSAEQIASAMAGAIGLSAATPQVDMIHTDRNGITLEPKRLRARYAMRFGEEKSDERDQRFRGDEVRQAFNSPFRPFVLITTSLGQEGLDFHPYCHAVVHWNLPSNPVDLEQREGRVHRYKGHAVRRNIAERYGNMLSQNGWNVSFNDPWQYLFRLATDEPGRKSDLTPFWIYPHGQSCIERHVPALPMSREISRMTALRQSLVIYRMVFGQPRQEDLLEHLQQRLPAQKLEELMDKIRIDLAPHP